MNNKVVIVSRMFEFIRSNEDDDQNRGHGPVLSTSARVLQFVKRDRGEGEAHLFSFIAMTAFKSTDG